ncbi:hypothetical protein VNO80_15716 [Phaseolus coccineus]|uniref:Uncharacterized protein n=1 Tax=Phaseolus coccineus TaxID=3886 RepID=A0AAN9MKS3_PHACN
MTIRRKPLPRGCLRCWLPSAPLEANVYAHVADEIQWPLAKDDAVVKFDDSHHFSSFRSDEEEEDVLDVSCKSQEHKVNVNEIMKIEFYLLCMKSVTPLSFFPWFLCLEYAWFTALGGLLLFDLGFGVMTNIAIGSVVITLNSRRV